MVQVQAQAPAPELVSVLVQAVVQDLEVALLETQLLLVLALVQQV